MSRPEKTIKTIAIIFSLIGLAAWGGALALAANTIRFRSSAALADGVVTDLAYRDKTARPVVEFVDARGIKHEVVSSVGSDPPAYSIGEHVRIYYQVGRPEQARIGTTLEGWGGAGFLGLFGTAFGGIGGGMLLGFARRARLAA